MDGEKPKKWSYPPTQTRWKTFTGYELFVFSTEILTLILINSKFQIENIFSDRFGNPGLLFLRNDIIYTSF